MIVYFRSPWDSLYFLTLIQLFAILSITMNMRTIEAFPSYQENPTATGTSQQSKSLSSISNLDSMRAYLTPKCDQASRSVTYSQKNTVSFQDCYLALSQLSYNASSYLNLSNSATRSVKTCVLTVSKVIENNPNSIPDQPQNSNVKILGLYTFGQEMEQTFKSS